MNPNLPIQSSQVLQKAPPLVAETPTHPNQLVALFKTVMKDKAFSTNRPQCDQLISRITSAITQGQFADFHLRKISMIALSYLNHDEEGVLWNELLSLLEKTLQKENVVEVMYRATENPRVLEMCFQFIMNFSGAFVMKGTSDKREYYLGPESSIHHDDVIIVDLEMELQPGMKGFLRQLKNSTEAIKIIYNIESDFETARSVIDEYGELIDRLTFDDCHETIQEDEKIASLINSCSNLKQLGFSKMRMTRLLADPTLLARLNFLSFLDCPNLIALPSDLACLRTLDIGNSECLTHLPPSLAKLETLYLENCPKLVRLPPGLVNLRESDCRGLTRWGAFRCLVNSPLPAKFDTKRWIASFFGDPPPALFKNPPPFESILRLFDGIEDETRKEAYFDYILHAESDHAIILGNLVRMERE